VGKTLTEHELMKIADILKWSKLYPSEKKLIVSLIEDYRELVADTTISREGRTRYSWSYLQDLDRDELIQLIRGLESTIDQLVTRIEYDSRGRNDIVSKNDELTKTVERLVDTVGYVTKEAVADHEAAKVYKEKAAKLADELERIKREFNIGSIDFYIARNDELRSEVERLEMENEKLQAVKSTTSVKVSAADYAAIKDAANHPIMFNMLAQYVRDKTYSDVFATNVGRISDTLYRLLNGNKIVEED
jgi:regulator of replication initiation timing